HTSSLHGARPIFCPFRTRRSPVSRTSRPAASYRPLLSPVRAAHHPYAAKNIISLTVSSRLHQDPWETRTLDGFAVHQYRHKPPARRLSTWRAIRIMNDHRDAESKRDRSARGRPWDRYGGRVPGPASSVTTRTSVTTTTTTPTEPTPGTPGSPIRGSRWRPTWPRRRAAVSARSPRTASGTP